MVSRELDDTTPISTPSPVNVKAVSKKTNIKAPHLSGKGTLKNKDAVGIITIDITIICSIVVNEGIITIEVAGTPLIL
ncbi:unnamed protein product [marine sediment metagenome]|uniref:Uncharacterized protein n=1 Tax=marine sediment metagenome TaxID=412755 RepID=X1H481_9ZZZZ